MKIYKLMWFNEDAYGPTDWATFVVQAEDTDQAKYKAQAEWEKTVKNTKSKADDFCYLSKKFSKFEISDITDQEILWWSFDSGFSAN